MKLLINKYFEIGIKRSRGEPWRWKPYPECSLGNWFTHTNGKNFKYVNTSSYYVPTNIRIFWAKLIFYIKIKPKKISGEHPLRYVKYEDTHLQLMDTPQGNWNDKN